jgi:hypothetical protein
MKMQDIENEICRLDNRREQLERECAEHAGRLSQAEDERQQCVLAAKIDGDVNAQKRLRELELIADSARRAIADDGEAIAEIGRRLVALQEDRHAAKIEEKRSEIQQIINARLELTLERRLASLKEELAKTANAILAENRLLVSELRSFGRLVNPEANEGGRYGLELRSAACHVLLALKDIAELDLCGIESDLLSSALRDVSSARRLVEV